MRSKRTSILVSLMFLGVLCWGQDWNRWRGPHQDGSGSSEGAFSYKEGYGLQVEWKNKLGVSYSSISVVDNQAVTMESDGTSDFVISFDTDTKKTLWKYKIGPAYKNIGPDHDGPNSTLLIENGIVFGLGANGYLFSIRLNDGKEIWKKHLERDFGSKAPEYGHTTSPLLAEGVLIVQTGKKDSIISGINPQTGQQLWSNGEGTIHFQSPVFGKVAGTDQVVAAGDHSVFGLNPKTGTIYWRYAWEGEHQSNTPLLIGKDRIHVRVSPRHSIMLQVFNQAGKQVVKELWKTDQGSGSLADPIYHQGYIYTYSRRFLACLDAGTGALKWKSRPPGDGWLMKLDDKLVVLTRRGVLHLVELSTVGYKPLTEIKVLDEIVWTPPSFGDGRLFVRSIGGIVTVTMAKGVESAKLEPITAPKLMLPQSEFNKFVDKVAKATDKKTMVETYLKGKSSPIYEGKDKAHVFYYDIAKDMVIVGDMLEVGVESPMVHVDGTDLWYASFQLKPDSRLNYFMVRDFDNRITDPKNRTVVPSVFGDCSQLAMPDWKEPVHYRDPTHSNRGTLTTVEIETKALEGPRKVQVYLPFGYETSDKSYSTIYINHGVNAVAMGKMVNSFDNLIGNKLDPFLAVFIQAPNSGREYARTGRDHYAEMVVTEIVPYIDSHYRSKAEAKNRFFIGGDEGGYAALYAALKYPGSFSKVVGQSTHLMPTAGGNELNELVKNATSTDLQIYLEWGRYDYRNQAGGYSWPDYNESFSKLLKDKGFSVKNNVVNQGWGFASWRTRTDTVLRFLFPTNSQVN